MPITYYTDKEFLSLKNNSEQQINELIRTIKELRNERCNMITPHCMCCGQCEFHRLMPSDIGPRCTSFNKYLSK